MKCQGASNWADFENFLLLLNRGAARQPKAAYLEQLKVLRNNLKLGNMLCRSREPDFLLDVIHSQGPYYQSMPWLADLVDSNEGSLDMLPVQCLCEFLLNDIPSNGTRDEVRTLYCFFIYTLLFNYRLM